MNKIFLLDMDGVICNFIDGIIKSHRLDVTHDDWESWSFHQSLGLTDREMWEPTNNGYWWLTLEPYPWAEDLVNKLVDLGEVIFCTSPSLDHSCPSQKIKWLRDRKFMGDRKNDYQIGPRKELNAKSGAILIDDSDSNVTKYLDSGGDAILFPQPWNKNRNISTNKIDYVLEQIGLIDFVRKHS